METQNTSRKRFTLIASTMAAVLVGGGVAVAYWTATGSGNGPGSVGTSTAVTVDQDSTVSGLIPGGPAKALDFTVNNPAAGPQSINGVSVSVAVTSSPGTCDSSDFSITQPSITGPVAISANGSSQFLSSSTGAAISMVNKPGVDQNGCKGAVLQLTYTVS
jgi:predicted flavoprotein YhiN